MHIKNRNLNEGVWCLRIDGTMTVRRVEPLARNKIRFSSVNKIYPPYVLSGKDLKTVEPVGRLIMTLHRL